MADDSNIQRDRGKFCKKTRSKRGFNLRYNEDNIPEQEDHDYFVINDETDDHEFLGIELEIETDSDIDNSWKSGRRIVELDVLAKEMFCCQCHVPLHFKDIVSERRSGFGSILHIKCTNSVCKSVTDVPTGKMSRSGSFDVSDKIVIGMIHAGLGYAQVRNFMAELNLPVMSKSSFQRHEKKVGKVFIENADESCRKAQHLEKELSADKDYEVSFDAGWQRRGSGFNYNSLTGHASMIGNQSGKVTCYEVRSTHCKFCEHHKGKNETVPSHECVRNWGGSSKSMEPDMALSMAHKMADDGFPIDTLHGDNDSTTHTKLSLDFKDLKKRDDQNHTTKGMTKSLIALSKSHKELKSQDVVSYINRCFMYAILQNSTTTEIDKALSRIVPHIFGNHDLCDDAEWCSYKNDPASFSYKSLPNGKALCNQALRKDLEDLIGKYRSKSASLTSLGSTQANESFNHSVATRAPKNKHYGGSLSLKTRVASAVLQKNEGYAYLEKINDAAVLSPGFFTKTIAERLDKEKQKRKNKVKSKEYKKRRSLLKKNRNKRNRLSTVQEPVTYQSNIAMTELSDLDTLAIPSSPLKLEHDENFVFLDLECTSLSKNSDITEIAAIHGENKFQKYVMPRTDISIEASKVTGITCSLTKNKMYVHGKEVPYVSQFEALLQLIEFLKNIRNVVLVCHNGCNYDIPVLTNRLKEFSLLATFCENSSKFVDSLKIARRIFPKTTVENYKQATLVKQFVGSDYDAHSALEDVTALKKLFEKDMKNKCKSDDLYSLHFNDCKLTLNYLLTSKVISRDVMIKLARNGVSLNHLKAARKRDPNGIKYLLQQYKITPKSASQLNSFNEAQNWIKQVLQNTTNPVQICLVGNKLDLETKRAVSTEEGRSLADRNGYLFIETSAKTAENVHDLFANLVTVISCLQDPQTANQVTDNITLS